MHVTLTGVVLFLHIAVAIVAFAMAGLMHTALQFLARARSVGEMRSWAAVVHRLDPLFPVMALLLLGLGSWLVHLGSHTDDRFGFTTGWILTAIVALVVIEGLAGVLLAPRAKRAVRLVEEAGSDPVSAQLHAAVVDPVLWHVAHVATFGFLGVVFLMAAKPSGAWSPVIVALGVLVGLVASTAQLRGLVDAPGGPVPAQRTESVTPV
jgi:hypothetical protein